MAATTICSDFRAPQNKVCHCFQFLHLFAMKIFATPRTTQSMEFSRPEYWSGEPFLLQGIFPTQGSNPGLLCFRRATGKILKLNIQKTKIMAPGPITSWQIEGEKVETVTNFLFLGSKIIANSDGSREIKRCLIDAFEL